MWCESEACIKQLMYSEEHGAFSLQRLLQMGSSVEALLSVPVRSQCPHAHHRTTAYEYPESE
jgi:hypothetical protein